MKIHMVKSGETLYALSQKYGVPLQKIIEANPQISNPDVLAVGDKVKIPAATVPVPENNEVYYKHTVKQGDTLWKLSKAWGITLKDMIDANTQLKNPNALLVGEIVNIPKKGNSAVVEPQSAATAIIDKTKLGAKDYTGVKEQPPAEVSPVSTTPPPAPAPVPEPAPAPTKEPEVAPVINKAPEVSPIMNKAPEVLPAVNKAPELSPAMNKAPEVSPVVSKAAEVLPVHEMIHESQSLFVQISVPAQEAMTYEMPQGKSKSEVEPASWQENKTSPCDNSFGYPGLSANPYVLDSQPAYPYYQPMAVMGMNPAPDFVHPANYMQDCPSPYGLYSATEFPGAWYPNTAPVYENISPVSENSSFGMPQYSGPSLNLPWPSCGCGAGVPVQSVQPYSYEQPMYNNYPGYMQPMPEMISPYGIDMSPQAYSAAPSTFAAPMVSSIPAYPMYPGVENHAHNRVPEIQEPEFFQQETTPPVEAERSEPAVISKGSDKSSTAKVKTSSLPANSSSKSSAKQRTNQNARKNTTKKSKNPWISN
ncbi:LysM peptidoglycan-binding domain-containing protein [Paenibacillus jilunlii]|uniref:Morphogenetic protein associated with SpoVID n=1 Tax=Paenibacillus jilunlii TaxID=682956 RepID=A0A1G9S164_9BACL|nr:LysM peptidoglycan-binding domain-containing protein [Paenibacillus jilunlii]SDM29000.1 morphogenetic protein associated with SpoVID [Paenibacillus jilunlii]